MTWRLAPYEDYRPSGIPWVGDIPSHWDVVPNRAHLRPAKELVGSASGEHVLLSLTKRGIVERDMENPEGKFPSSFDTYQVIEPGDLVFCLFDIDETPRAVGQSSLFGMITGAYSRFRCADSETASFTYKFYLAMDERKMLKPLYTGLRKVITKDTFLATRMPLPPKSEQVRIVRYLDHIDSQLERFVDTKEQLIELLEEEKRAVIYGAVTRGLDPKQRLKPSGTQWMGEVPEHWDLVPLKRLARFRGGSGFPVQEQGERSGEIPFVKVSDMNTKGNETVIEDASSRVSGDAAKRLKAHVFPAGTIVFPKIGGALLTNKRRLLGRPCCIDNNVMGCTPRPGVDPAYVLELLRLIDLSAFANAGPVPAIGEGDVRRIRVAMPPHAEQVEIAGFAGRARRVPDAATSLARRHVTLLQEMRTRLISDVVTGKLDVREGALGQEDASPSDADVRNRDEAVA